MLSLILEQIDQSGCLSFCFGMAECILVCPPHGLSYLNPYLKGVESLGMGRTVGRLILGLFNFLVWRRWAGNDVRAGFCGVVLDLCVKHSSLIFFSPHLEDESASA